MQVSEPVHPVRWYVLSLPRANQKSTESLRSGIERWRQKHSLQMEYYAPTFVNLSERGGGHHRHRKPLLYNYVFLRSTLPVVLQFRRENPLYNLIRSRVHAESTGYLYVPDGEMNMFMRVARAYSDTVPCYIPTEVELRRGDRVRIVGGPFTGVEGILLSQQGKEGNQVVVSVQNLLSVPTLTIAPQYIEIISFSKDNKHLYDKLDSYCPRIRRALAHYYGDGRLDDSDVAAITYFLTRMGNLDIPSPKIRGKYLGYLLLSHRLMGHADEGERCYAACLDILSQVTNVVTRTFLLMALYAYSSDADFRSEARVLMDAWPADKLSAKQQMLITDWSLLTAGPSRG